MIDGVRLIATDLDGTLLRSDRTVSERTRTAIRRAQNAGLIVAIATARHPNTARAFAEAAGITGIAICSNGALIYDLASDRIISEQPLAAETAYTLIEMLRVEFPGICFAALRSLEFACEPAYAAIAASHDHAFRPEEMLLADALELASLPMTKLIARHAEFTPPEILARLSGLAIDGFESSHSGAPFLDVVAAGVSKAAGLAGLCGDLDIDASEVIALGDAPNDLPMLRWAGKPIAVANAYPEVLAEIAETTASNDDDGVAVAIERLLG